MNIENLIQQNTKSINDLVQAINNLHGLMLLATNIPIPPNVLSPAPSVPTQSVPAHVEHAATTAPTPSRDELQAQCLKMVRANPESKGKIKELISKYTGSKSPTIANLSDSDLVEVAKSLGEMV